MCGRFINLTTVNKIKKIFDINKLINLEDNFSYNIAPSQNVNVILLENFLTFEAINWGISFFNKDSNIFQNIINSRLETVKNKIIFKESYFNRRCLIPSNGYYEWKTINGKKLPFFFEIPKLETIFFAGIWRYDNKKNKNFVILTKSSNNNISDIHDRMPVILNAEESLDYLDNDQYLTKDFFSSKIEADIEYYKVSTFVNSPKNNSLKCIDPLD